MKPLARLFAVALLGWLTVGGQVAYSATAAETPLQQRLARLQAENRINLHSVEQALTELEDARLALENLSLEKAGRGTELRAKAALLESLSLEWEELKKQPVSEEKQAEHNARLQELTDKLSQQRRYYEQIAAHLVQLNNQQEEAQQQVAQAEQWYEQLQKAYQTQRDEALSGEVENQQSQLQRQISSLRQELKTLRAEQPGDADGRALLLEIRILDAEERNLLALRQLERQRVQTQLQRLEMDAELEKNLPQTQRDLNQSETLRAETEAQYRLLENKQTVLQRRARLLQQGSGQESALLQRHKKQAAALVQALVELYQNELAELAVLRSRAEQIHGRYQTRWQDLSRRALFAQRQLPQNWEAWQTLLLTEVMQIPQTAWAHLQSLLYIALEDLRTITFPRWLLAGALALLWLGGLQWARDGLQSQAQRLAANRPQHSFTEDSLLITFQLLIGNFGAFALTGLLLLLLWIIQPAQSTQLLVIALMLLWLGIKLPIDFARLLLVSGDVAQACTNPLLYRRLRWLLLSIGVMSAFTLLIHVWPFSDPIRELTDSLFMLFLSLTLLPILSLRQSALQRLKQRLQSGYWLWLSWLLSLLLVLSILAVSLLGLLGYLNLGWVLAKYLSIILLLLSSALITDGLLGDAIGVLKSYAVQRSQQYGLLWSQDIIPLFHKLLRLCLLLGTGLLLLYLTGWQTDSGWLSAVLHYPLLRFGDNQITPAGVLLSGFVLLSVIWFAAWTQRITYRWIYASITDLGIRHSLSVFTQYAMLLLGALIALRLLGLDLTTFTVFAGALGVGLGFGLQNIANNFVSGLLLLAERPLRTGDYVEIGDAKNMGEVTRIGIRSLTIRTWDNQEVIVPNSQVISNSFTNWTHTDPIVRTVLNIGVSYSSDLRKTKAILEDIVRHHEGILQNKEPKVYLANFADSAVMFLIHYHTNLRDSSRLQVQSDVLFSIYERFAAADIEIPYPQRDVHIRHYPAGPMPALG